LKELCSIKVDDLEIKTIMVLNFVVAM